ncbi:hypothetical protein FA13DRAFT_1710997 [Coprinellus micaceus]|uniref:Uncharacterized protein n=1 Tax=Coprinellus micaceus TaxID=71717 RepID=A0A4Y7T5H2_COPMI|nr:hypothetical protein FA13DRAFT_1710997 [Coprinellus micaceus]
MAFPALEELNIFHGDWASGLGYTHPAHLPQHSPGSPLSADDASNSEGAIFRLLEETPHPPPVLKGLKIRLPEAPWSAEAVRAIEDICRDVGLSDVEIVVVDQSRGASIPSMSILGDESDRAYFQLIRRARWGFDRIVSESLMLKDSYVQ